MNSLNYLYSRKPGVNSFNKRNFAQVIKLLTLFSPETEDGWTSELVAFWYLLVVVIRVMVGWGSKERD